MRDIRTSGLMSGEGKRSRRPSLNAAAPLLDSTTRIVHRACESVKSCFVRMASTDSEKWPDADGA
jgi:hypothetical protein